MDNVGNVGINIPLITHGFTVFRSNYKIPRTDNLDVSVYSQRISLKKKLAIVKKARSHWTKNGRWQLGVLHYGSEQVGVLSQAATQKVYITATHKGKFHAQLILPSSVSIHTDNTAP